MLDAFDFLDMNGNDVAYGREVAMDLVTDLGEKLKACYKEGRDYVDYKGYCLT